MDNRRKALGLGMMHAEAAVAEFVSRIIGEDPAAVNARERLYSVGLTPNLIYSLRNKRQRELGAAKLGAALAACEDLEITVVGEAKEGASAPRWIVRAEVVQPSSSSQGDNSLGERSVKPAPSRILKNTPSPRAGAGTAIQLSLFGQLE